MKSAEVLRVCRRVGCATYVGGGKYLLSTFSVVGAAQDVEILDHAGRMYYARVVGRDPLLDVVLLEVPEGLESVRDLPDVVTRTERTPGEPCLVMGNTQGRNFSAARGILGEPVAISAGGIPTRVVRVRASILPGDMGGAVIDAQGRLLGMVTGVAPAMHRGRILHPGLREGEKCVGFVLPAETCRRAWEDLREFGRVRRGYLGVLLPGEASGEGGACILRVVEGGPAHRAGLARGDVVIRFGDVEVGGPRDLCGLVCGSRPGVPMDIAFLRQGVEHFVTLELGEATRVPRVEAAPDSLAEEAARRRPMAAARVSPR
jgi:serine protease Do